MEWLLGKDLWLIIAGRIHAVIGLSPQTLGRLLNSALVILAYLALRRLLRRTVARQVDDLRRRYTLNKSIGFGLGLVFALLLAKIWLLGHVSITTYLGILSAGLAIALKDPIVNLAGWLFILVRHPFKVGDRIELGGQIGDVTDLRLLTFTMVEVGKWVNADQSTGRMIHVPNGQVFSGVVANYSQGFPLIWNEIPVVVTFESDWQRAHDLLSATIDQIGEGQPISEAQAQSMTEEHNISYKNLSPIVWIDVIDFGVRLTARYLCSVRARRSTADRFWRATLLAFAKEPTIDFAYPTQRFFANDREGKPGAGGPPER